MNLSRVGSSSVAYAFDCAHRNSLENVTHVVNSHVEDLLRCMIVVNKKRI